MSESKALFNFDFNKKIETPRSILEEQSDILLEQSSGKVRFFIEESRNIESVKVWTPTNTDFKIKFGVRSEINTYKLEIATFHFNISGFPCFVYSDFAIDFDVYFTESAIEKDNDNSLDVYVQSLYDSDKRLTCKDALDLKKVLMHILSHEQIVRTVEVLAQV